jgi:hypothetical protein
MLACTEVSVRGVGPRYVQLNVHETSMQMLVGFNSGGMITVLPKRPLPSFALVVFLSGAAGNQLHTAGDNVWAGVFDQKMDMIAGDNVIQHRRPKRFLASNTQRK